MEWSLRITWGKHFSQCQNMECARYILVFVPGIPHKDLIKDALSHLTDVKTETPRSIQPAKVICLITGWAEKEQDREDREEGPSGMKAGNGGSGKGRLLCEWHSVVTAGGLWMTSPIHTRFFHWPRALLLLRLGLMGTHEHVWTPTNALKELFIPKAWCLDIQTRATCIRKENAALYVTCSTWAFLLTLIPQINASFTYTSKVNYRINISTKSYITIYSV